MKEKDKIIKRKTSQLRYNNIELQQNNAVANDLYADDSNEDLDSADGEGDRTKGKKIAKTAKKFLRKGRHLPYSERQQFHQELLTSLNQMSDQSALQAMMDIQSFIKQCRDLSE